MKETFPMVAKTFQGLEDVLSAELEELGAENVEIGLRMVTFEGDLEMLYKANMCCRTALRILKPISKFTASNPDELYDAVRDFDWDQYLTADKTFAIDSTVNSTEFTHSKFVTYRVKDGIADYFNDKYGRRPSIRLSGADLCLNVHIAGTRVTISLDSSGESLNKRGYRVAQTEAPINEVLAAGIIMKTGWHGESNFIDPMCGSGTFLIEAALIAANINPGVYREHFAFETWPDFDKELFEEIYNDDSQEREFAYKIYGGDIAQAAVATAMKNVKAAHVDDMVEIECKSFTQWDEAPLDGIMITNPPYGERLNVDDMAGLYHSIGSTLKRYFKGYHAWILGYKEEYFNEIGLKPSVKFPILNGSLECELREYVLFEGSYSDFKTGGGSTRNEKFNRESKPKVRHMNDSEWAAEARKFGSKNEKATRSERREFKKDERRDSSHKSSFKGDKRSFYDRDENRRQNGGGSRDKRQNDDRNKTVRRAVEISGKGPSLPEESATVFSKVPMRSRKGWKKQTNDD